MRHFTVRAAAIGEHLCDDDAVRCYKDMDDPACLCYSASLRFADTRARTVNIVFSF